MTFQIFLFPGSSIILQNMVGSKVEFCLTWGTYVGLHGPLQKCSSPKEPLYPDVEFLFVVQRVNLDLNDL